MRPWFLLLVATLLVGAFVPTAFAFHVQPQHSKYRGSCKRATVVRNKIYGNGNPVQGTRTRMAAGDNDFWTKQKELAEEMAAQETSTLKEEQMIKYNQRANALVGDTAFTILLVFPTLWLCFDNPLLPLSYLLGATFGLAYCYGLGKYVATLGGSVDDANTLQGAGVGNARFAFLILLFIFVGKFRSYGLEEIPCIAGFFTYQLASLVQALKEMDE